MLRPVNRLPDVTLPHVSVEFLGTRDWSVIFDDFDAGSAGPVTVFCI